MTTITINERTKAGKSFLEFAKNLPFVTIKNESGSEKKVSGLEQALDDEKKGKTKKYKNSKDLFKKVLG